MLIFPSDFVAIASTDQFGRTTVGKANTTFFSPALYFRDGKVLLSDVVVGRYTRFRADSVKHARDWCASALERVRRDYDE